MTVVVKHDKSSGPAPDNPTTQQCDVPSVLTAILLMGANDMS